MNTLNYDKQSNTRHVIDQQPAIGIERNAKNWLLRLFEFEFEFEDGGFIISMAIMERKKPINRLDKK